MGQAEVAPIATSIMRQFLPLYVTAPTVIVIAQQWPCWLSTVLALEIQVVGAYFSSSLHHHFQVPGSCKLKSWATVEDLKSPSFVLDNVVVLASGSLQFLPVVEHLRPTKMIFAVDVYFPRMGLRDCT